MKKRYNVYLESKEVENYRIISGEQTLSETLNAALKVINILLQEMDYKQLHYHIEKRLSSYLIKYPEKK